MGRTIRYIIMALLLAVFCTAGGVIFFTRQNYEKEDKVYEQLAEEYTSHVREEKPSDAASPEEAEAPEKAPLEVDFDRLKEINGDVAGWIYCEDTAIDYPILQGEDNDYYLHRNIERQSQSAGSIFVEAANQPGFEDSNTIIYGHHMKNGSMFAALDDWAEQEFYEAHPVIWLLTPEQDYKILVFAGYTTSAASDTYTIFTGPCSELEEYLEQCVEKSDFRASVEISGEELRDGLDGSRRYVVLSTCAYSFEDARYVLHGVLVPVER